MQKAQATPTKKRPRKAKTRKGWGLYRPDGTLMDVYFPKKMDEDHVTSLLGNAWGEIKDKDDHRAGTPVPHAANKARELGYRILPVSIIPISNVTPATGKPAKQA